MTPDRAKEEAGRFPGSLNITEVKPDPKKFYWVRIGERQKDSDLPYVDPSVNGEKLELPRGTVRIVADME
jgi:hypothetical protein